LKVPGFKVHRRFPAHLEVVHQHHALVRVKEPVTPALEPVILRGVRIVTVQKLHVADLKGGGSWVAGIRVSVFRA
jgi:hypothetical protein